MKGPPSWRVCGNSHGHSLGRLDDDRMLARQILARAVLQVHPHAVQVERMFHHRIVHECEAHTLAIAEVDRFFGFPILLAVERPHIALHVTRKVDLNCKSV